MRPSPGFWNGLRVAVTGGGFLGWHLVTALRRLGARVRVLTLSPRPGHPLRDLPDLGLFLGDLRDPALSRAALDGCDVIFHTAGTVAVWGTGLREMHGIHVEGTRRVLAATPPGARVVHTSSLVTLGPGDRGPVDEETPSPFPERRVEYVEAKRDAEAVALRAADRGQDVVITNPGYLVGPEDHDGSIMGRLCVRAWKGRVPLAAPGGFSLADVRDVAAGHLLAAEHGVSGRRYVLGGENHTFAQLLRLLRVAGGEPASTAWAPPTVPSWLFTLVAFAAEVRARWTGREPYPSVQSMRVNRHRWFCRSDRARSELGYQARPVLESLREAYHWFCSAGVLGPCRPHRVTVGRVRVGLPAGGQVEVLEAPHDIRLAGETAAVLDP